MESPLVTRSDIAAAAERLEPRIRRTPVLTVPGQELDSPHVPDHSTISLKLEYLQHSGTFKGRGAMHFMLTNEISSAGVTAASGGNHGAAVAWAAQQLGHRATIFVPTISAAAKVDRLRSYGAEVVQVGAVYAESLEACAEHQNKTGATGIHAYEAPDVFAGAGTTGREFELQVAQQGLPPLDFILVACGGGGLVGGIATWFGGQPDNSGGHRPTIVACETNDTAAYAHALAAGRPVDVAVKGIAADALGATSVGILAFAALQAAGASSALVDDQAVLEAQRDLWDRFRIVVEPSAAVPMAALRTGAWAVAQSEAEPVVIEPGSHIGVVVCGANTGFGNLES